VATVDNAYRDPDRTGQRIGTTLDRFGNRGNNASLAQDAATTIVTYNTVTGHNVPRVFRDFIQNGPVEGLFAFGYPITDPYWVRARVGGEDKDVLVQLYERRVVTYTPSNPPAFRVEMGNVGQHYFQWRYPHLGQPWQQDYWNLPIAFASRRASPDHWEVFVMGSDGNGVTQVTSGQEETVPYSWRRAFQYGDVPRLMTDSKRVGGTRQLFSITFQNWGDVRQHTDPRGSSAVVFNGAVSPDGTQIAAAFQVTDPGGQLTSLGVMPFSTNQTYGPGPQAPAERNCRYESPSWLPDGSGLVFAGNCNGKFAIYRGDLRYNAPPTGDYISAEIVNIRAITNTPAADNYFPRVSPDGTKVAFASNRSGTGNLYLINIDGSGERRLTNHAADDGAASWSPDGSEIVFDSNRDGDYELYRMNLGTLNVTQLTFNNIDDRWPLWYQ
jgi:Tol biopolymer transport system component